MTPDEVIAELNASNLRGRGGAFFPTGRKWSFVPKPDKMPKPHYLVVNADESEPGTFKDREIMLRVPFRFLEGCADRRPRDRVHARLHLHPRRVRARVRGARRRARADAREGQAPRRRRRSSLHRGAGAYICGEETALLESLEGKRGQPRTKPPFPAIAGLYASPTAVNNVESITTVPPISSWAAPSTRSSGSRASTGTRVFSLSGNVVNGRATTSCRTASRSRDLIYDVGGGIADGRTLKAVIPGGSSTAILTADEVERVTLDFDSLDGRPGPRSARPR